MSTETESAAEAKAPTEPPAAKKAKAKKPMKKPAKAKSARSAKKPAAKAKAKLNGAGKGKKPDVDHVPTGQGAKKIGIDEEKLNAKEKTVLSAVRRAGEIDLTELAARSFPSKSKKQGNSWTRNALRRLVRERFVKKSERGTYKKGG